MGILKANAYRVLIIEDEPNISGDMEALLLSYAKKVNAQVEPKIVADVETAQSAIAQNMFHAAAIDLRLPDKPGSPLTSQAHGLDLAATYARVRPLGWAHMFSAFAKEYALEAWHRMAQGEMPPMPIWEKAISDKDDDDHYTQEQWAQRILTVLLPKSSALKLPLVQQRPKLKAYLTGLSPLGESVDFAVAAGRKHLPPCLARSCAIIQRWLAGGDKDFAWSAFQESLFLAEIVQHWLWVQAAAWLAVFAPKSLVWPLHEGNPKSRAGMQWALHDMLKAIAQSPQRAWAEAWLSHLNYNADGKSMDIVDALEAIRDVRNRFAHQSQGDELPWEEIAVPMRVLLDAAGFLAAYPVLFRPTPAPDGRWRFSVLKGENPPLPEQEWSLDGGVLGEGGRFAPARDEATLYQLWPCPDGSLGLLKLWPFAEQRVKLGEGRTLWLLYGPDPRNPSRLWERSALDGREHCEAGVAPEKLEALRRLGAQ